MKTNILIALKNLSNLRKNDLTEVYAGSNRMTQMGEALEFYVRDLFCNSFEIDGKEGKIAEHNKFFSYLGSHSKPPDAIIRNGDAIEVKKIKTVSPQIALNSSYPKAKLYVDSSMIAVDCRECEDWDVKDIIYIIGVVQGSKLKFLWFVYGDCYCADKDIYEQVRQPIIDAIRKIPNVELSPTTELGRLNKIDPLGITNLRVRGMWHIDNPIKVFKDIVDYDLNKFNVFAIMRKEKFESFNDEDRACIEEDDEYSIQDVEITDLNDISNKIAIKCIQAKF